MAKEKTYLLKEQNSDGVDVIQKISKKSLVAFFEESLKDKPEYLKKEVPLSRMIELLYIFSAYEVAEIPDKEEAEVEFVPMSELVNVKLAKWTF